MSNPKVQKVTIITIASSEGQGGSAPDTREGKKTLPL